MDNRGIANQNLITIEMKTKQQQERQRSKLSFSFVVVKFLSDSIGYDQIEARGH